MEQKKTKRRMGANMVSGISFAATGAPFLLMGLYFLFFHTEKGPWPGSYMFIAVGGFFFLFGMLTVCKQLQKRKEAQALMAEGRCVWGTVAELVPNTAITINGRHPVTAVVHYADGSGTHIYRSTDLPLKVDWRIVGQSVKVYLDTADPEKYHVDTDELLERCAIR